MIKIDDDYYFQTENMILHGGSFWFAERQYGDLLNYDYKTDTIKMIWECKLLGNRAFGSVTVWNENIIMVPFNSDCITIIDLEKKEVNKIQVKKSSFNELIGWGCIASGLSSHIYDGSLFITSSLYPGCIEFVLDSKELRVHKVPDYDDKNLQVSKEGEVAFFRSSSISDNKIYMPSCRDNKLYVFDCVNKSFAIHKVGDENDRFSGAIKKGDYIWIAPRRGDKVIRWSELNDESESIYIEADGYKQSYSNIFEYYNDIRLLPMGGMEMRYDSERNTFIPVEYDKVDGCSITNMKDGIFYNNSGKLIFRINGEEITKRLFLSSDLRDYFIRKSKSRIRQTKFRNGQLMGIIEEDESDQLKELIQFLSE